MKTTYLRLLLALGVAGLTGCAAVGFSKVPFGLIRERFEPGDSIIVEQVLASSSPIAIGDKVVVKGMYRLQSRTSARLGLSLSTKGPSEPTIVVPGSRLEIVGGSGRFELQTEVRSAGGLHVSFYPAGSGSSFGGVYFASVEQD